MRWFMPDGCNTKPKWNKFYNEVQLVLPTFRSELFETNQFIQTIKVYRIDYCFNFLIDMNKKCMLDIFKIKIF